MIKKIATVLAVFCISTFAQADFVRYDQQEQGDQIMFSYVWKDAKDTEHQLGFSFNGGDLYDSFRSFASIKPNILQRHVEFELQKAASEAPWEVRVHIDNNREGIAVRIEGEDAKQVEEWHQKMTEVEEKASEEILQRNFYNVLKDPRGRTIGIKPDHVRFILESTENLRPMINAVKAKYGKKRITARHLANYLLSFTQSIPYSTLEDRVSSSGHGFSPPTHVLYNNLGDCDSKATFMAAVFRDFFPRLGIVMIYLRNHALIGINLPLRQNDEYVTIDGVNYLLAEAAGPALIPFGQGAPTSMSEIDSGNYAWEKVPMIMAKK